MIEDMQLAGLSATTQEVYLQAVTALVKHYRNRSPNQLTEEDVRCYLLAVRQRNARGTAALRRLSITISVGSIYKAPCPEKRGTNFHLI
jgi:hypothetical protein